MNNGRQIEVRLDAPGERLDKALAEAMPAVSRVQWQRLIKEKQVTIAGQPAKASMRLVGGEVVTAVLPPITDTDLIAEEIPLDIRYEDDDLLLINKPAGMVVHPGTGHERGTLVNAVLFYCPDVLGVGYEKRPGIVHRLDKDTSGLILVAKNDAALRHLQAQFQARTVQKMYLALVEGHIQPATALIDAPIGRNPRFRKRMSVLSGHHSLAAKPAQTQYHTLKLYDAFALVTCYPRTGRTHQIRVHLAYVGYPIVGDTVYGRRKQRITLNRHFLHAAGLTFKRPSDDKELTFETDLPSELQAVLDKLEEDYDPSM